MKILFKKIIILIKIKKVNNLINLLTFNGNNTLPNKSNKKMIILLIVKNKANNQLCNKVIQT